jgi:type I restriction enzyme S subunit
MRPVHSRLCYVCGNVCVNSKFISTDGHVRKFSTENFCPAKRGDILMVMSDLPNGKALAKTYLVDQDNFYAVNQRVCALTPYRDSPRYLAYILNRNPYFLKFDDGVSQTHLLNPVFEKCRIPVPPTRAEQEAIADSLNDADALIGSLERVLAKRRQLKLGAMQELLTAKRRVGQFGGDWERRRLAELADIRSGGTPSTGQSQFWGGNVLWCTPTDITALNGSKYLDDTDRKLSQLGLKASAAEMIPANSVVMTSRATIGECAINRVPLSTNQGFKNFIPVEGVDVEFLYYLLLTQKQRFISLCGGSTFLEISKTQLAAFEVRVPATKAEQSAIAAILSDMDADIAALEEKLTKARQLKQGMMQELLTGRIRLI